MKPRLLDLFCCAGGAGTGYHRAGFDVVGVDINPQPNYPFEFHQADAMTYPLEGFDAIHASPPCQAYSRFRHIVKARIGHFPAKWPELIDPIRERLQGSNAIWIIENVEDAPLRRDLLLCGSMFGLAVKRHRVFETNAGLMLGMKCGSHKQFAVVYGTGRAIVQRQELPPLGIYGHLKAQDRTLRTRRPTTLAEGQAAMGIDWMTWRELCESIPPAYTEWIGKRLLAAIEVAA